MLKKIISHTYPIRRRLRYPEFNKYFKSDPNFNAAFPFYFR